MQRFTFTAVAGRPHDRLRTYLRRWLPRAVEQVARAPEDIAVSLVGDRKMAELHEQFLQLSGPTDVLTFELDHDSRGRVTAGEIVVCVPYARREAAQRKIDVRQELLLYALHGVLHLSGYDDLTPAGHRRMHKEEDRILERIGIGRIFSKS